MARLRNGLSWLSLTFLVVAPAAAQTPSSSAAAPSAPTFRATPSSPQAYYEFLMARRLEAGNDLPGALSALGRAIAIDPTSAELLAERAALHARQNQGPQAVADANRALAIDAKNAEAHRILGLVYAAWAEGSAPPPAGETAATLRTKAIDNLQAIQGNPAMATDLNLQVTLGRLLLRAGQTEPALRVLQGVVSQSPYAAEPYVLFAEATMAVGRVQEAAEALSRAAQINPRYYASLADLYERENRWAAAAGAYSQAVANVRTPSRDLKLRWVTALLNVPDGEGATRAREVLGEMLTTNAQDTRVLYLLSTAARQQGDQAAAEDAARKALAIEPAAATGLLALSRVLADRFDYRQVVTLLTPFETDAVARGKGRERESATVLVQLGLARQQLGDYDAAITVFEAARTLVPGDVSFDIPLIQAQLAAQRFAEAEALGSEALARAPGDVRLLRLRSKTLARAGRSAEAVSLLEAAAAATPEDPEVAQALGDAYAGAKRYDEAVRHLQQTETRFGEDGSLTLQLAAVFEEAGRMPEAEREFRRLLAEDPLDATVLNYLGYMLADRSDRLPEAQSMIERALTVDADNPAYLDSLGWVLFKQGRIDEAEAPLARAAAALPGNSVIQDHHGQVLAGRGKWDEAIAAWQRALAGDGESIDRRAIDKKISDARSRRR